jgi:hypothetical protein
MTHGNTPYLQVGKGCVGSAESNAAKPLNKAMRRNPGHL